MTARRGGGELPAPVAWLLDQMARDAADRPALRLYRPDPDDEDPAPPAAPDAPAADDPF